MSKETQLKKEFKSSDLNRIRNIIAGKHGSITKPQIGFTEKVKEYKEGDVWEVDGKSWTILNGIKQSITKLDYLKKIIQFPLKCPRCNNAMKNTDINKKMYIIHKTCFDCVLEVETKMKLDGTFDEYEKGLMNGNKNSILEDFENALDEYSKQTTEKFITEDGIEERWLGGGVDIEYIKKMKEEIKLEKSKNL